jgi:hypothetical protein
VSLRLSLAWWFLISVNDSGVQLMDGKEEFDFWTWDEVSMSFLYRSLLIFLAQVKMIKVVSPPPSAQSTLAKVLKGEFSEVMLHCIRL